MILTKTYIENVLTCYLISSYPIILYRMSLLKQLTIFLLIYHKKNKLQTHTNI